MAKTEPTYHCNKNYYAGENAKFEHVLNEYGRINFDAPPEGYRYTATPIEQEMIVEWNLDSMFVTRHKFGTNEKLCYMELVPETLSRTIVQPYKAASTKANRYSRCRIVSPKTGKAIMCPYDGEHSCCNCPVPEEDRTKPSTPLSLDHLFTDADGEEGAFDIPDETVNIEEDYAARDMRECIRRELTELDRQKTEKHQRAMHLRVYDLWVQDYSATEISEALGIKKATLHDDMVRIAKIVQKYM